jgi:release factor glutamine methyltransferase
MNIQQAVDLATALFEERKVESPRLSAELIAAHVTRSTRTSVIARPGRSLSSSEEAEYQALADRRAKSEPVPYLIGEVEFYSITFAIVQGVFIPRPETESLVDRALEAARRFHAPKVLDLGTGCGNILIAMAHTLQAGEFHGTDISSKAIQCARQNVRDQDLVNRVTLHKGNVFQALRGCLVRDFDVVVCNPPYVKTGDIADLSPQIRDFEPHVCLDGGRDGLDFYRTFIDNVAHFLSPHGVVCLEIDPSLARPVSDLVERGKVFDSPKVTQDQSGRDRVVGFTLEKQ